MSRHWPVLAGVMLAVMGCVAMAQTPTPTADEEAMARARRQAENPLRRILEASRITVRRRVVADAPEAPASAAVGAAGATGREQAVDDSTAPPPALPAAAAAPSSGIRITVEPILPSPTLGARPLPEAGPAASGPPARLPAAGQGSVPPMTPETIPTPPDQAASARVAEVPPGTPPQAPVFKTMEWSPDQPVAPASAPFGAAPTRPATVTTDPSRGAVASPLATAPTATLPPAMPPTSAPAALTSPPSPALRTLVEPTLTDRLRDELGRVDVVAVDLTLAADGTVQDAAFLSRVPPGVRRVLMAALLQWRYEALPEPMVHRVELAFER